MNHALTDYTKYKYGVYTSARQVENARAAGHRMGARRRRDEKRQPRAQPRRHPCPRGSTDPTSKHVLRAFFTATPAGRRLAHRFPHTPGTLPCKVRDEGVAVQATCATDISLVQPARAAVTLTEAWNHGAKAHTWFFFIRRDGTVQSVIQEGSKAPKR